MTSMPGSTDPRPSVPTGIWAVLAVVRLLAEIGLLVALGYAGWRLGGGSVPLSLLLAAALPGLAASAWGRWVAPRSSRRLADPARFAVEVTLFALAAALLTGVGPVPATGVASVVLWVAYLASAGVGRRGF